MELLAFLESSLSSLLRFLPSPLLFGSEISEQLRVVLLTLGIGYPPGTAFRRSRSRSVTSSQLPGSKPVGSQPVPSAPPLSRLYHPQGSPPRRFLFHSSPSTRGFPPAADRRLCRLRFTALSQSHRPTRFGKLMAGAAESHRPSVAIIQCGPFLSELCLDNNWIGPGAAWRWEFARRCNAPLEPWLRNAAIPTSRKASGLARQ